MMEDTLKGTIQMEKRMKLIGEEVLLGTIGPIMKGSGWAYSKASEVYKTTWNKLTKSEKVELAKSYLREARETFLYFIDI